MIMFKQFLQDESGATAIEYGLIAALIAVAIIGAVFALGGEVTETFQDVTTGLENRATGGAAPQAPAGP